MKCTICGKEFEKGPYGKHMGLCSSKCWDIDYMWRLVRYVQNEDTTVDGLPVVRVNGKHYIAGEESAGGFKGYGGRKFHIEFVAGPRKGQRIITKNLWHRGDIEDIYKPILPDNAVLHYNVEEDDAEWLKG